MSTDSTRSRSRSRNRQHFTNTAKPSANSKRKENMRRLKNITNTVHKAKKSSRSTSASNLSKPASSRPYVFESPPTKQTTMSTPIQPTKQTAIDTSTSPTKQTAMSTSTSPTLPALPINKSQFNFSKGINTAKIITPLSINASQRKELRAQIVSPFLEQQDKITKQRQSQAFHARSHIKHNHNTSTTKDIDMTEDNDTIEDIDIDIDIDDNHNDDIRDKQHQLMPPFIQDQNNNNHNHEQHHFDNDQNNINENNDDNGGDVDTKLAEQPTNESSDIPSIKKQQKNERNKQGIYVKRLESNDYYLYVLTSNKWYWSNDINEQKQVQAVMKSSHFKMCMKNLLGKNKSKDNLVRGMRQIYFMNGITLLLRNGGNRNQKVSKAALKFCFLKLPFIYFNCIGDIPDRAISTAVQLICKHGERKQNWETVNDKHSKKFYLMKSPTQLMIQIIRKYKQFDTDEQASQFICNDDSVISGYKSLENTHIDIDWKTGTCVMEEIYSDKYKGIQWKLQYNAQSQTFVEVESNDIESNDIESNDNDININEQSVINQNNLKIGENNVMNSLQNNNNNKIGLIDDLLGPKTINQNDDDDIKVNICHFRSNGTYLSVFSASSIQSLGHEILENRVLKLNTSIGNIPHTPYIENTEFAAYKCQPKVQTRSFEIPIPGKGNINSKHVIVLQPCQCKSQLYVIHESDNSKLQPYYQIQSSINACQYPASTLDKAVKRKGNAIQHIISSDLVPIDRNDLTEILYDEFDKHAHRRIDNVTEEAVKEWFETILIHYDIVQKYIKDGILYTRNNPLAMSRRPLICERKEFGALHGKFVLYFNEKDDEIKYDEPTKYLDLCIFFLQPNIGGKTKIINFSDYKVQQINIAEKLEKNHLYVP